MNNTLSAAIKEAYTIAPTDVVIFETLEIRQFRESLRLFIVNARHPVTATDEAGIERTYEPVGFKLSLPPVTDEGVPTMTVAIDNVGQRAKEFINTVKENRNQVEMVYRPYLSNDLTIPQINPPILLYLSEVSITSFQITGRAKFVDLVNKPFPSEYYTLERFPTLV